MKMLKKYAYMLMLAVAAIGFTACTEDGEYSPATAEDGTRVFFSNEATTEFVVENTTSSVAVTVLRNTTEGALEASVSASFGSNDYASLFTVAPTVVFNDGANAADVTISFDRSKLAGGASYEITVNLVDETLFSNFGAASQTITISVPEPYVLLGKGWYRDDIYASGYSNVECQEWQVEIYENTNTPGYIYLKDPYKGHPNVSNFKKVYDDVYFAINVAYGGNEGVAMIPVQFIGIDVSGDGRMQVGTAQLGTFKDGVITFPTKGLVVAEEFYNNGAWYNNANNHGMFRVVMPGIEITDYAMSVAYGGMTVAADNKTTEAVFKGTYGADVASFKYVFFKDDVTAYADQIAAGVADGSYEIDGEIEVEMGLDEEKRVFTFTDGGELEAPGSYTVAVIPCNADGELQTAEVAVASFYYAGVGAELPECKLQVKLLPYTIAYEPTAELNDSNSMICLLAGEELKTVAFGLFATATYEGYVAQGYPLEAFVDPVEDAISADALAYANDGGVPFIFKGNLPAATSFTAVAYGMNTYGSEVYLASEPLSTTAAAAAVASVTQPLQGKGMLKSLARQAIEVKWVEKKL